MKILLTGGAGFIGSNVAKYCVQNQIYVDVVDNLSNGHIQFVPKEVVDDNRLFLTNFDCDFLLNRIRQKHYDVVIHLAAQPRVSYSVEHPYETHQTNVTSSLKLIDACRGNINKFIFASTSAVYGNVEQLPTQENAEKNYQSPYAIQKLIIEDYLRLFGKLYDFDSVCLRFFNVFGPNQLGNSPYATAVSSWLNMIMRDEPMRSDGDGSQSRDMCHVDNVVDACMKSVNSTKKFMGEAFNVACGQKFTNKEIIEYLLQKFPSAKFYNAPWRLGDVMHTQADLKKIYNALNYRPIVTFWDGLDSTILWYQKNWEVIKELSTT